MILKKCKACQIVMVEHVQYKIIKKERKMFKKFLQFINEAKEYSLIVVINYKTSKIYVLDADDRDELAVSEFEPLNNSSIDTDLKELYSPFKRGVNVDTTFMIADYKGNTIDSLEMQEDVSSPSDLLQMLKDANEEFEAYSR
jgi:DNA-binding beta-propeller fold protein YncE